MSKIVYTAHATAKNGRNGHAETNDGALKLDLASPGAPNTKSGTTNPEQLFACGYAACFGSAVEYVAQQKKIAVTGVTVNSDINLNMGDDGFSISATLNITVSGLAQADAEALVAAAHQVCPYSKATRGNIAVTLKVNDHALAMAA
jgi:hypothetical protein